MEKIQINNESGDRKYFTIIPNYIYNHSTLWDREVYCQMKRIAGEHGICWTSQNKLSKQCGISINRLKKSLKYLIDHKWIKYIGEKEVISNGGLQKTNIYEITDLWKMNIDYYNKGVSPSDIPNNKGVSPSDIPYNKGVSPSDTKVYHQESTNNNPNNNPITIAETSSANEVNILLGEFQKINPLINFGNKTQRKSCENIIKIYGLEYTLKVFNYYLKVKDEPFCPFITTPYELETKWAKLEHFYTKDEVNIIN